MKKISLFLAGMMLFSSLAYATITEKVLGQSTVLSASNSTIYTVPASTTAVVKTIWVTNTTATDTTIEMWAGSAAGDANKLMDGVTIPASDFMQVSTYLPLETTDTLQAKGSTNVALSVSLFGAELT